MSTRNRLPVVSRRDVLKMSMALPFTALGGRQSAVPAARVVVVGAGAFGGWTALMLARTGARVTLVDAWGPGNARASSGGETRVIRAIYGPNPIYVRMVARALTLWREHEEAWKRGLYRQTGALWMLAAGQRYAHDSIPLLRENGFRVDELPLDTARTRYPQIDFTGIAAVVHEEQAGYLLARRSCEVVVDAFQAAGGTYLQRAVTPPSADGETLHAITLNDGTRLSADRFVFACGPWLGRLFPDVVGDRVTASRQEVFYFGTPAGDPRFLESAMPVWVEVGSSLVYGIPGNVNRGFKFADDSHGARFDPTSGQREITAEGLAAARRYLAMRFPALADAPLLGGEVCQYENSPDGHFIIDRHPRAANVWLVGGGSGHGFKMAPAIGEIVASAVLDKGAPDPFFRLARFSR